jgi:outer membrane protein
MLPIARQTNPSMKLYLKFFLFLSLLISSILLPAQEVWDWAKCIDYAIQNNIQLKQADLNIQLGESTLKQQKLNYSPNINASSNYNLRIGNNFNFFTSAYTRELVHYQDYGFNITQPVFDGLITPNNVKKSRLDLQALQLDKETLRDNIQLQILTAFLNIMNAGEQYEQAKKQKTTTEEQYERTKSLIDAGAAAENALLDIDAQLTSEELAIAQVKNQLDLAYLSLRTILQLDAKKEITIQVPELPESLALTALEDVNTIYADALNLRPEIKSSQLKTESAKKSIAVAKGNYHPTPSFVANANTFFSSQSKIFNQVLTGNSTAVGFVEGTFQRVLIPETLTEQNKNPYNRQLNQNLGYAMGLTLNVPIFNKYQVQTAVKQSKLQFENAMLTEKQTELDLLNTIQQAHLKAQASIDNFKAAERNFSTSKKSYDFALDRLNAGSIDQLSVNLAKTNLSIAESRLTQAKYEYLFNTKVLDFYQGKKITLD